MNPKQYRSAYLWLGIITVTLVIFLLVWPSSRINSSILDLLPQSEEEAIDPKILDTFNERLDQQLVWLVRSSEGEEVVTSWINALGQVDGLNNITQKMGETELNLWGKTQDRFKALFLDAKTKLNLSNGQHAKWVISQIYSPFSGVSVAEVNHDPLLLIRANLFAQVQNIGNLTLDEGWLVIKDAEEPSKNWYFIRAEIKESSYSVVDAKRMVAELNKAEAALKSQYPNTTILKRGTLYYSDYASDLAVSDISTIGVASLIGIVVLILLVFRSVLPIGVTLLALTIGILCGSTAVLLIFGEIHIITIVMSTSIVGVSIDYTLLFLTERMINGEKVTITESRRRLSRPLLGALISTLLAYFVLFFAPFAGLQQLALFTIVGLIAVFLTVLCWFPLLTHKLPVRNPQIMLKIIDYWIDWWSTKSAIRYGIPCILLLLIAGGIMQLKVNDDVGALQDLPLHLVEEDRQINELIGQQTEQKFILLVEKDTESLFSLAMKVFNELELAIQDQILTGYRGIPYEPIDIQKENVAVVNAAYPLVIEKLRGLGLSIDESGKTQISAVSFTDWLDSPIGENWRLLWQELADGSNALIIPLEGIQDENALKDQLTFSSNVHWIDRKTEVSDLFATYRVSMMILLAVALSIIAGLFLYRFGVRHGFRAMIPITFALAMGLSFLGWIGNEVNLFTVMALILVLGMGIDYTLFFINRKGDTRVSMLTIFSAALISELTFGLLGFSQTKAISSFGIVLAIGILTALLLAPLAIEDQKKNRIK